MSTKVFRTIVMAGTITLVCAGAVLTVWNESRADKVTKATGPTVVVYKSPTCGCCGGWADHMRDEGFRVERVDIDNLAKIKAENGVPRTLQSCHTALVDGYVIEGHVPAQDVRRLLSERPQVTGIGVPGMPAGSPGMEGPRSQPYDVLTFDAKGTMSVFAKH